MSHLDLCAKKVDFTTILDLMKIVEKWYFLSDFQTLWFVVSL